MIKSFHLKRALPSEIGRKFGAFSLVEMLMALLVASLLLAALAPVITKRFGENINVAGATGGILPKTFCAYTNDGTDLRIIDDENTGCIVPDNTFAMNIIMASGGGGGGGAVSDVSGDITTVKSLEGTRNENEGVQTTDIYYFDNTTKIMEIALGGGGGGAGGAAYYSSGYAEPRSQEDCKTADGENFGAFIAAADNGGKAVCVSLFNPGENRVGSPDIPSSVESRCKAGVTSGTIATGYCGNEAQCKSTSTANCCWSGKTASQCANSTDSNMNYSGCNRTVCQFYAGKKICESWKPLGENGPAGRLPTKKELESWAAKINYNSTIPGKTGILNRRNSGYPGTSADGTYPGLQSCSRYTNSGAAQCYYITTGCAGAGVNSYMPTAWLNHCFPAYMWSSDQVPSDATRFYAYGIGFTDGIFKIDENNPTTLPYTVRCVLAETHTFTSFSGGGGSAGAYLSLNIPTSILSEATKEGKGYVKMYTGSGGKGGASGTSNGDNGGEAQNGTSSKIEIYDSKNILLYSIEVPGGLKGSEAKISGTTGTPGEKANLASNKCPYFNKLENMTSVDTNKLCSDISTLIEIGTNPTDGGVDSQSTGGKNTMWGTTSNIGSGGSGKFCTSETECPADSDNGGCGGLIRISTAITYPGAGGGGGGAGGVIHIKSAQVRPDDFIKIQAGHGGNGGIKGDDGKDGGDSYVEIIRGEKVISRYEISGGKGGSKAVEGVPSSNTEAIAGKGGEGGEYKGIKPFNSEFYPSKKEESKGGDAKLSTDTITSEGGNGGINPKISPLAKTDGELNGTPCGGLSQTEIKINDDNVWSCTNPSNIPLPLSRSLTDGLFTSEIIKNLAPGGTGGGGGGWKYGATPAASGGAKGMGGYVYIYFGEWGEGR